MQHDSIDLPGNLTSALTPAMKFRLRLLLFLACVALVGVIFFYHNLRSLPATHNPRRTFHLGPRYNDIKLHHGSRDEDYVVEGDEDDGIIDMKRGPVPVEKPSDIKDFNLMSLAMVNSPEDQQIRDEGYRLYAFNQLVSDRIGFHRPLPDTRHHYCQRKQYPSRLPKASIIICFYNELWSALLRTVYSVLDRSPEHLIHEIILVDDASELAELGSRLQQHVEDNFPMAKLVRAKERHGLIRARNLGVEHASGEVLVFLDSHCEVNVGWLEPLLAHVSQDRHSVAIPMIDIISPDTFAYQPSPLMRGGFNWGLHFRWDPIPGSELETKEDFVKPVKSPTMAGGLFAMDREYFMELGMYDPGMEIWGGENLEISFRVWQCGGRMHQIPCSRCGHIFRKRRPYGSLDGTETMISNSLRVAHVWMDEYKEYFFKVRPDARSKSFGDIKARINLRHSLKCHDFKWYLAEVYPSQTLPDDQGHGGMVKDFAPKPHLPPEVLLQGHLHHTYSGLCVVSDQSPYEKRSLLKLALCDYTSSNKQQWSITKKEEFRLAGLLCLDGSDATVGRSFPRLMKCTEEGATQAWHWIGETQQLLLNAGLGQCLSVMKEEEDSYLALEICDKDSSRMKFHLKGV